MTTTRPTTVSMLAAYPRRLALVGIAVALGLLIAQLGDSSALGRSTFTDAQKERLRNVTAAFHSEDLATSAGFEGEPVCVSSPDGGMGFHHVHEARVADGVINRDKPEILLYAPSESGERKLVGVEYFKVDSDQDLGTDDDRPTLFGRPFDGPMEGHAPGMPIHYDLHVWMWKRNPLGVFAPFNPNLDCQ